MHGNARLTPIARLTLVTRIEAGKAVAHVAAEMGVSRPTAYKWWRRWRDEGVDGLADRSSRPRSCPHQTSPEIEAHCRVAYSEIHDDEKGPTCAAFWHRACEFFAGYGINTIDAVLTDNAKNYTGFDFTAALGTTQHRRIRPRRPQTNGKIERFNRTLLDEWAYARPYTSDEQRTAALDDWLHIYNHHRHHTAIGGPPITAVNNDPDQYS